MQLLSIYRGYTCTHLTTFIMLAGFAGKQFEHLVSPVGVCTVTYISMKWNFNKSWKNHELEFFHDNISPLFPTTKIISLNLQNYSCRLCLWKIIVLSSKELIFNTFEWLVLTPTETDLSGHDSYTRMHVYRVNNNIVYMIEHRYNTIDIELIDNESSNIRANY